jgi:ribulose-bisphosphate carboxylase large chain
MSRINAQYRVRSTADAIAARAKGIAVEQSVEMPLEAIDDALILSDIVGRVDDVTDLGDGLFDVRIGLAVETTGLEAGQLLNMLFGNTSIHDDVVLWDAEFPDEVLAAFGGPRHGIDGLRARVSVDDRALTCSALKPQGLSSADLAELSGAFAAGGVDYIKDDHGLADQAYCRFAERVPACAQAVRRESGGRTRYAPSLSGHLGQLRDQVQIARNEGLDTLLIAPMVVGLPTFHAIVAESPDMAFMVHPAMTGNARIAPPFLFGRLLRLMGADAAIFTNHGGRFAFKPETCHDLAAAALAPWGSVKAAVPVPAGGMTLNRVSEMLKFYGTDVMLLIGGDLLRAGKAKRLTAATAAFVDEVARRSREAADVDA